MNVSNRPIGAGRIAGFSRVTTALRSCHRLFAAAAAFALAATASLPAQTGGTGTITGRVFNPTNGEYVRNVEVSVAGTNLSTQTEGSGFYQLFNVPAGEATLNNTCPGFNTVTEKLTVTPGATAVRDFELTAQGAPPKSGNE